ncbi:MAG: hypothetical protein HY902_16910 [Deltaproteobacteria bacterium]|nr:hypothetical protein [Deltaproteobacteria bacterium]
MSHCMSASTGTFSRPWLPRRILGLALSAGLLLSTSAGAEPPSAIQRELRPLAVRAAYDYMGALIAAVAAGAAVEYALTMNLSIEGGLGLHPDLESGVAGWGMLRLGHALDALGVHEVGVAAGVSSLPSRELRRITAGRVEASYTLRAQVGFTLSLAAGAGWALAESDSYTRENVGVMPNFNGTTSTTVYRAGDPAFATRISAGWSF